MASKKRSRNKRSKTRRRVGGDLLGTGAHKATYNLGCISGPSLCTQLKPPVRLEQITLYCKDGSKKVLTSEPANANFSQVEEFVNFIAGKKGLVASLFIQKFKLTLKTLFEEFEEEVEVNRLVNSIYDDQVDKYTAAAPLDFNGQKVLGAIAKIKGQNPLYIIFSTKCKQIKVDADFDFDKFIFDILESLVILQGKGYEHNDIKLDNIVACPNGDREIKYANGSKRFVASYDYKLIDWGQSAKVKEIYHDFRYSPPKIGARISTSPMRWYLSGRLLVSSAFAAPELIQHMAKTKKERYGELASWTPFENTTNKIKEEFKTEIENVDYEILYNKYKKTFDVFMLGMTLLHALYMNGNPLVYKKYKLIVNKFLAISNPLPNAEAALEYAKSVLKNPK